MALCIYTRVYNAHLCVCSDRYIQHSPLSGPRPAGCSSVPSATACGAMALKTALLVAGIRVLVCIAALKHFEADLQVQRFRLPDENMESQKLSGSSHVRPCRCRDEDLWAWAAPRPQQNPLAHEAVGNVGDC